MAVTESSKPSSRDESSDSGSGSDSEIETPAAGTPAPVEWLATGRSKRSTAGNRMKSMLANEEPDSDLELLFAEDDNDEGFTDVDDAGSDVHMDSSSDDEDEQNQGDEMEGEKELEKQARERKAASRKRKAQDAIPAKFRKKVRIDSTQTSTPVPRPKKKSERASWLPSPADMPIRASLRQTTMLSKEQLHLQMKEREAKRLKQLAIMEKKAKKLEAMKKPPMTQAERLAEAAMVEKRNSKSLNRWEEAEKIREEERLAKLAALQNRTLKGPVVTYWSGIGQWEHHLKHVGRVAEEEKPVRKKREKKEKGEKGKGKDKEDKEAEKKEAEKKDAEKKEENQAASTPASPPSATPNGLSEAKFEVRPVAPSSTGAETPQPNGISKTHSPSPTPTPEATAEAAPPVKTEDRPSVMAPPAIPPPLPPTASPMPSRAEDKPRLMAPPTIAPPAMAPPPSLGLPSMAPPPIPPPPKTTTSVLAAPVLAPPVLAPPLGGIHLGQHSAQPKSNVLAPPNTSQHKSPLSMPAPPPPPSARPPPPPLAALQPVQAPAPPKPAPPAVDPPPPSAPSEPPAPEEAHPSEIARNAFILRNFNEDRIKDKTTQTQILFGRRMDRMAKPAPRPICVITAHPARYRDPDTGLPYFNAYAYREIQRLRRGEYKWSSLIGAWVGSCTYAARGVPERFLKGDGKPKNKDKAKEAVREGAGEGVEQKELKKGDEPVSSPPREGKTDPDPKGGEKTVPSPSPSAVLPQPQPQAQTQTQTQTQQQQPPVPPPPPQVEPPVEQTQIPTQEAKPVEAEPAPAPVAASVATSV